MKKGGWRLLLFGLLAVSVLAPAGTALANQWGLTGPLYREVASAQTWDSYTQTTEQCGNFAILGSRYHNALFYAEEDTSLAVYHTAVWQPEDQVEQMLKKTDQGIILCAGTESFTFRRAGDRYALTEAQLDDVTVTAISFDETYSEPNGYCFTDGTRKVVYLYNALYLEDFNIRLFPRTVEEVLAVNLMEASLASGVNCLEYRQDWAQVANVGKKTAPVYSAPFGEASWRAAKGKACVSLKDSFTVLRGFTNGDGEDWTCVMYEVSERTSRIGWVKNTLLGDAAQGTPEDIWVRMLNVEVEASRDTFLTDDPFVSNYAQFTVPEGTDFNCMGLLGNDWAYVSAEVSNKNTFTDGGAIVWGFIPLRDLILKPDVTIAQQDVMQQLEGTWYYAAGGGMAEDRLTLHADGTYEGAYLNYDDNGMEDGYTADHTGTWYVTEYKDFCNKYWYPAAYEITLIQEDGYTNVKGLSLDENGFSLFDAEGSGGYERTLAEDVPNG